MKRLAICLLLLSGSAWADWKNVAEDELGVTYVDLTTAMKRGTTTAMWSVLDYKSFQRMVEVGYFSQKTLVEYDCAGRKSRGVHLSLHAEHMGQGKVVYSDESPHEWESVPPGTLGEKLWKMVCQ